MEKVDVCEPRDIVEAMIAGESYTRSEENVRGIMCALGARK
jgi:hypothetical protein